MAPYFLIVEGHRGPKKPHPDLQSARAEAARLYALQNGEKRVLVLETKETIDPPEDQS